MAIDSGKPNRKLMSYYRQVMDRLGYKAELLVTGIIRVGECGKGDLHPHKRKVELNVDYPQSTLDLVRDARPRLAASFKDLPDEELIVDGVFIIARSSDRDLSPPPAPTRENPDPAQYVLKDRRND